MGGRRVSLIVVFAVGLAVVLVVAAATGSGTGMKKLGIVIYATDEVIAKGAIVSIHARYLPVADFEARYPVPEVPPEVPGAPDAARQWHAVITGPVNMVYFEIPDDWSYTYRFRALPKDGIAEARVLERVTGVAGRTFDAAGQDEGYVRFGLIRSHEIASNAMNHQSVDTAPDANDFGMDHETCPAQGPVRVCVPDDAAIMKRAVYLSRSSGRAAVHPWGR